MPSRKLFTAQLPYHKGFRTQIQRHVPPDPYGTEYYDGCRRRCETKTWTSKTASSRLEFAIKIPPRESSSSASATSCEFEIIEVLAGGARRGAQIVRCKVRGDDSRQPEYEAVAKIYDSVYYDNIDPEQYQVGLECCRMHKADGDYSCEAAVYETLETARTPVAGIFTPRYYGSWTFSLSHDHSHVFVGKPGPPVERPVRMILIEYLNGCSMHNLVFDKYDNPRHKVRKEFHESYRLYIWAQLLKAKEYFKAAGLCNEDEAPRNVMLVPVPTKLVPLSEQPLPRVVLIDFNLTYVKNKVHQKHREPWFNDPQPVLPYNPIESTWSESAYDYESWVPEWYEDDEWRQNEWLLQQFGREKAVEFMPLSCSNFFSPEDLKKHAQNTPK